MRIPFLGLKPTYLELKDEFNAAWHRVMDSGWYLLGSELECFEQEYAAYCGAKHCVGVGSGLDALHLALRAWKIGPSPITILNALQRLPELVLPFVPADMDPVWHLFVVRHPCRDELQRHLAEAGIGTLIHYPVPPHLSGAYSDLGQRQGAYPITEEQARMVLSLPIGPHLNEEAQNHVIAAIRSFR